MLNKKLLPLFPARRGGGGHAVYTHQTTLRLRHQDFEPREAARSVEKMF